MKYFLAIVLFGWFGLGAVAQTVTPLFARGYTVIPEPQKVSLESKDFTFDRGWQLKLDKSVASNDIAVEALRDDLAKRFHITLAEKGKPSGTLTLKIATGSVPIGKAQDLNKAALEEQAYRIDLHPNSITITANANTGLFYGVDTLIQLLRPEAGTLRLPEGSIVDWPDLQLRHIYWDNNHHLDKMDVFKHALRQAAFYKINGFVVKLNGHFQYKSAPAVVEPYALSPAQLQELTDYGLRYHVQLIPYLDGPGHIAFILKHPEYKHLREYPDNNYEICSANPESYKLLEGMYQDLIDANKGVKYFYLSTDESYYVGLANNDQCNEVELAKKLGSVGKVLAHFVTKTGGYLHDQGRTVMFWGEYPLKPSDIPSLPSFMVNGETYGPAFDKAFRKQGIRQMIYTSTQGVEDMFPKYFPIPQAELLHPHRGGSPRIDDIFNKISFDSARQNSDLIGEFDAGWGDEGLHPETFWMGYVASGAAGWHPASISPQEYMETFYPLFYGPRAVNMNRVYQLMSEQGQLWTDTWDTVPAKNRKPILGNSNGIFKTPQLVEDQVLPLPADPTDDLEYTATWSQENTKRLAQASRGMQENNALLGMLGENIVRSQFNHYNLEVYLSIAYLCRQNFQMIAGIHQMDKDLAAAAQLKSQDPEKAIAQVDRALDEATKIWRQRNDVLHKTVATWYKSSLPKGEDANGRHFLHELDDIKDHLPDRTVGMDYLVYREKILPFGTWVDSILAARNKFAKAHNLPARTYRLAWDDFKAGSSVSCSSASELLANPQMLPTDTDQAATCGAGN